MELENDAVLTARHFDTFNLINMTILFNFTFATVEQLWNFQNRMEFKLKIITLPFYKNYKV